MSFKRLASILIALSIALVMGCGGGDGRPSGRYQMSDDPDFDVTRGCTDNFYDFIESELNSSPGTGGSFEPLVDIEPEGENSIRFTLVDREAFSVLLRKVDDDPPEYEGSLSTGGTLSGCSISLGVAVHLFDHGEELAVGIQVEYGVIWQNSSCPFSTGECSDFTPGILSPI